MAYRYEDLGDDDFQRMCGALLVHLDQSVQLPPLGQTDGGFDGYRRTPGETVKILGHQVKWTGHPERVKDPVKWLLAELKGERDKIEKMVQGGTAAYLMITNVKATAKPVVGRMDRADEAIVEFGKELGIRILVWWRGDLDARLDSAPAELKFSYPNMLVGADAMRALLADALDGKRVTEQATLLRLAARTQWDADQVVGFRQGRLEGVPLDDLFIDVTASRTYNLGQDPRERNEPQGALKLLMSARAPQRVMLYGAPGQGKSTLVQKLCQEYRRLLRDPPSAEELGERERLEEGIPRLAFKIVLRDYSLWLSGQDPLAASAGKRPRGSSDSVESFAAYSLHVDSGGLNCSVADLVDICGRFPSLFAFDGLDEVADVNLRARVVEQIAAFDTRTKEWDTSPQVVVTSRPSFDRLPEPNSDTFIRHTLEPLSEDLRIEYLRKWARSQSLAHADRREVERIFRERSGQGHIRELATNPMQLTILLYLIHQRGEAVPQRRTDLYADYLQSFLDREAAKSRSVRLYREPLEEVTAFLGWFLQSRAERDSGNGRARRSDLMQAMKYFLVDNGRDVALVDELFTAVTTRVWALTSRVTDTFEFDVQSIREYFAARYIFDRAPTAQTDGADSFDRFRQAAIRPYWANTARFMAGLFRHGEKSHLADKLIEDIGAGDVRFWPRRLAVTLIQDGIFDAQPAPRRRLIEAAFDQVGVRIAVRDIDSHTASAIPIDRGGSDVVQLLCEAIEGDPADPLNLERARLLSMYRTKRDFVDWWIRLVAKYPNHRASLLHLGLVADIGTELSASEISVFDATSVAEVSILLAMGVNPGSNKDLAGTMLRCVLDGWNASSTAVGRSEAASLAHVVDLPLIVQRADSSADGLWLEWDQYAMSRLRGHRKLAADVLQRARRERVGQRGTTSLFSDLADAVASSFGRCWLANEVAIIGASASGLRMGHAAQRSWAPFGQTSVPSALVRDLRERGKDIEWWLDQKQALSDDIDRATWLVALIACNDRSPLKQLLSEAGEVVSSLPPARISALIQAVERISKNPDISRIPTATVISASSISKEFGMLLIPLRDLDNTPFPVVNEGSAQAWTDALATGVWEHLKTPRALTSDEVAVLASAGPNVLLRGPRAWPMPQELQEAVSPSSPWTLLHWLDQTLEQSAQQVPLLQVADEGRWFIPAP